MRAFAPVLLLGLAVGGCGDSELAETVWSAKHPGVAIQCQGEKIPADLCVRWAEQFLESGEMRVTISRLVVTFRGGEDGTECSAEFYEARRGLLVKSGVTCPGDATSATEVQR
jgi:hypothetical protein